MADDNDIKLDDITASDFSLESILAEYKGSAFINGDKKTPPEILNEQTEKILREVVGSAQSGLLLSTKVAAPVRDTTDETRRITTVPQEALAADDAEKARPGVVIEQAPQNPEVKDNVVLFFENYRSPTPETQDSIVHEVEEAIKREFGETTVETGRRGIEFFGRSRRSDEETETHEEEIYEEPDLKDAAKRFALVCNSISLRSFPALLVTLLMVVLTFAFEAGMVIPFGIGRNQNGAIGALMIALLIVMMLCADIIIKGVSDLAGGAPNVETLILFSCSFSVISGAFSMLWGESGLLPYCAVSATSLTAAAIGSKINLQAMTDTLKTATASSEPYGVRAEYNKEIDKSVLKKAYNRTDGFYNNLVHPDVAETAYRYATPILLAVSLVLASITAIFRVQGVYFLHILSALLAAAAPFSATLAYALPFGIVAKSIRKSGAAIAGWGGADDVFFTDGACVTDEDLFPPGTLELSGMKLFEGASPEKAIRYTASIIIASGSGLTRVFSDVLKSQGMNVIKVDDFACYEGGISALVRGERVMAGSAAFMELLHVRIPDEMNMKNAIYTAINNKLAAMFAVEYTPANSVQGALISILKWRIKLFFAVRDFNVSPSMLEQKFRVSLEDFEYVQAKDSYSISDLNSAKGGRISAILTREGLGPFAEAITGSRLLKSAALVATGVSVAFAAVGVIIMFYLCWTGALVSARPGNLVLFMLSMLAVVLIVCGYAKTRR